MATSVNLNGRLSCLWHEPSHSPTQLGSTPANLRARQASTENDRTDENLIGYTDCKFISQKLMASLKSEYLGNFPTLAPSSSDKMFISDAFRKPDNSVGFLSVCGTLTTLSKSGGRLPRVTIGPHLKAVNLSSTTVARRAPSATPLQGRAYGLDTIDLNEETSIICRFILSPLFIYPLLI